MMVSGHLHRPYLIGCGVRSDDPDTFRALSVRAEAGEIDHIQVLVIPEPDLIFRKRIETIAAKNVLCILHAPHHLHGVNPCCPAAARGGDAGVSLAMLEAAVCQTYEMADELRTPVIVLHAGHYQEGRREEAVQGFYQFLDRFYDPRLILENLPAVFRDLKFIGTTASDLLRLSDGKIKSYCLDFAHLYRTSIVQQIIVDFHLAMNSWNSNRCPYPCIICPTVENPPAATSTCPWTTRRVGSISKPSWAILNVTPGSIPVLDTNTRMLPYIVRRSGYLTGYIVSTPAGVKKAPYKK